MLSEFVRDAAYKEAAQHMHVTHTHTHTHTHLHTHLHPSHTHTHTHTHKHFSGLTLLNLAQDARLQRQNSFFFEVFFHRCHVVKPCSRCKITTTDQETGYRGEEPLATLSSYRLKAWLFFPLFFLFSLCMDVCISMYVHMYVCVWIYTCIYRYIAGSWLRGYLSTRRIQ
jgi:hypothetical protein